jgi:hypothetical protein
MTVVPIKVVCHSGYKADEYPICFYVKDIKFEIKEICDRWYPAQPTPEWPVADYFKVCTEGNMKYLIKHELKSDQWFLVARDELIIKFSAN